MKPRKYFQINLPRAVQDNRKTHFKNKMKQIEENLLNSHKEERIQVETKAVQVQTIKYNSKLFFKCARKKQKMKAKVGPQIEEDGTLITA